MIKSNQPIISAIVAMAENRVIGINNQLPWHLPADLKHFKSITQGHAILMGRKTHESIGKTLPNRINIILTRNRQYHSPGCEVVSDLQDAIAIAKHHHDNEIFIIGGAEIYQQLLPQINRLYLTTIHQTFEGDTLFPLINQNEWQECSRENHAPDEMNHYSYTFSVLNRISS